MSTASTAADRPLRIADAALTDIADKLDAGDRLSLADGLRLFEASDLFAVG